MRAVGTNRSRGVPLDAGPVDHGRSKCGQLGRFPRNHSRALVAGVLRATFGVARRAWHLQRAKIQLFLVVALVLIDDDPVRLAASHDPGRTAGGQPIRREHQEPILPTSGEGHALILSTLYIMNFLLLSYLPLIELINTYIYRNTYIFTSETIDQRNTYTPLLELANDN